MMKMPTIKVIKRKLSGDMASVPSARRAETRPTTVTTTVKDWIAESRQNKEDNDVSSREIVAGWALAADI